MAIKNPYSPLVIPGDWKGTMRNFGTQLAQIITDIYLKLTKQKEISVTVEPQTFTSDQKAQARTNLGLGSAATRGVANNLTTTSSSYVLDARQGKTLNDNFNDYICSGTLANNTDLNTVKTPGYYFIYSSAYTYTNLPIGTIYELIVSKPNTGETVLQIGVGVNCLYFRFATSATAWSGWQSTQNCGEGWQADGTNIDNLLIAGRYGIDGTRTYTGTFPTGVSSGLLEVISASNSTTWIWQRLSTATAIYMRYRNQSNGTAWGSWYKFTGTLAQ